MMKKNKRPQYNYTGRVRDTAAAFPRQISLPPPDTSTSTTTTQRIGDNKKIARNNKPDCGLNATAAAEPEISAESLELSLKLSAIAMN